MTTSTHTLLKIHEVEKMTSLSRSTLYVMMRSGDFPEPLKLGQRAVRWRASEVQDWLDTRPRATGDLAGPDVNGGGMLGHWGGVKLYHPVGSCPPKKSELTGQHKCPRQWLRGMPCLRAGQQTAGRKVLILPILRQARLKVGRQRSLCYA